jgi:hypothetical protein
VKLETPNNPPSESLGARYGFHADPSAIPGAVDIFIRDAADCYSAFVATVGADGALDRLRALLGALDPNDPIRADPDLAKSLIEKIGIPILA